MADADGVVDALADAVGEALAEGEALGVALLAVADGVVEGRGVTCGEAAATWVAEGALDPHAARVVTVPMASTSARARGNLITRPRTDSTSFAT